jgi:general stress protein 26
MNMPEEIEKLLKTENFCILATSYQDHPHVSLMNFTYLEEENLILLSSREDTTKVRNIKNNPEVALLLYNLGGNGEGPVSCTIHGTSTVAGSYSEGQYRAHHYKKHLHMGTFIEGENISMITIEIKHAALSDVEDKVRTWNRGDGSFDS